MASTRNLTSAHSLDLQVGERALSQGVCAAEMEEKTGILTTVKMVQSFDAALGVLLANIIGAE